MCSTGFKLSTSSKLHCQICEGVVNEVNEKKSSVDLREAEMEETVPTS